MCVCVIVLCIFAAGQIQFSPYPIINAVGFPCALCSTCDLILVMVLLERVSSISAMALIRGFL